MFSNTEIAFASLSLKALRKSYFLFFLMQWEKVTNIAILLLKIAIKLRIPVNSILRKTIFQQFCGGETLEECSVVINNLAINKVSSILDYAVEGELEESIFDKNYKTFKNLIEFDYQRTEVSYSVFKITAIADKNLLEKKQSKLPLTKEESIAWNTFEQRLEEIFYLANQYNISLMIDAEETWIQSVIDDLVRAGMKKYNTNKAILFNTYQMYLKDKYNQLVRDIELANDCGYKLGIKLVRGAYMEKERSRALEQGYESPVFQTKADTDESFDSAIDLCMHHSTIVSLCCASHNETSVAKMVTKIIQQDKKRISQFSFAQLYGMGNHITFNLAHQGFNTSKYLPFGKIESVIPYLIRRAQENKSVNGQMSRELRLIQLELKRRKELRKN